MNGMSMKAFAAKVKSKVGGKSKSGKGASKRDLLPLELSLGPHKLALPKGSEKGWRSEASDFKETEENSGRLQGEVGQLRSQIEALEKELVDAKEEKYLAEFKSKLLVEMLAVAQLDAEKNAEVSHEETLKVEALKWELAKRNLASQRAGGSATESGEEKG